MLKEYKTMTANIQVYNLATREKLQDLNNASVVDLSTSSVVQVDLYKEDIKQYLREGNNLVLILNSGEKILIEDFFIKFNDQPQSQLVLLDRECGFLWFDYNNGAVYFKDITGLEQIVFGKSTNFWPWILGAAAIGGIAALIDDDKKKTPINPTEVTGNSAKGVEDSGEISGTLVPTDKDGVSKPDFTIVEQPKNGTAVIDPVTGKWTYTPNKDWYGTDTFKVSVTDDKNNKTEFIVSAVVEPEQDAFDDSAVTSELTPVTIDVLANDAFEGANKTITHVNGQPITEGASVNIPQGVVKLENGKLVFTPAEGVKDTRVDFSYTAKTDTGIAETAQVTVLVDVKDTGPTTVTGNTAEALEDDYATAGILSVSAKTAPSLPVQGQLIAQDPDGVAYAKFEKTSEPAHGQATVNSDGTWTYTPHPDWHGTDSFKIQVSDDKGFITNELITVVVKPEQDAFDDSASTDEDTPVTIDVLANDAFEGKNKTITKINGNPIVEGEVIAVQDGRVELKGGQLIFTPDKDQIGEVKFNYTANTDQGVAEDAVVTVVIKAVDDAPPEAKGNTGQGLEDTTISGTLEVTDVDGSTTPNFTLKDAPKNGTASIDPITGAWKYTPVADWHGTDEFTVDVTDDQGFTTSISVTVTVDPEQDAFDDTVETLEDTPVVIIALDNDEFEGNNPKIIAVNGEPISDGDSVTLQDGILTLKDGQFEFKPNPNYAGPVEFEYTATTDTGIAEDAKVLINVTPVNDPPVAEDDSKTTPEDTPIEGTVVATDPDDDDLTYTVKDEPKNGTVDLDPNTGEYIYTPNLDYNGPDEFTVIVKDPDGLESVATITIDITPVNDPPVAQNDSKTTLEDTPIDGKVLATDPDGDDLTYTVKDEPKNGKVELDPNTGDYIYTPNEDYSGSDEFTVIVKDPDGEEAESVITIEVIPQDDGEIVYMVEDGGTVTTFTVDDGITTNGRMVERTSLIDDDLLNRSEITVAYFRIGNDSTEHKAGSEVVIQNYGTVKINSDGTFAFTPAKDFYSEVQGQQIYEPPMVHYRLQDSKGLREESTVAFHVEGVNDAPVAADVAVTVSNNTQGTTGKIYYFDLDDFDVTDVDHDISDITLLITQLPTNGILEYYNRNAWVRVTEGDRINYSTVEANRLRYKPNDNGSSEKYDTFKFKPDDGVVGSGLGKEVTLTIRVLPGAKVIGNNVSVDGTEGNDVIIGNSGLSQNISALHGNDFIFADGINTDSFKFDGRTSPAGSGLDAVIEYLTLKIAAAKDPTKGPIPTERDILDVLKLHPEFFPSTGGDDTIRAGAGRDMIFSGGGDDIIYASQGYDFIHSGAGKDTLIYDVLADTPTTSASAGHNVDTWNDFNPSEDTIQFDPNVLLGATAENIAEYIQLTYDAAAKTVTLAIDLDGAKNEYLGYQPLLVLENQSAPLDLQKLIDDGRIVIG